MHYWFAPKPSEIESSRLVMDFGLRKADLFYRELVVPQLGRIFYVRQLSWPVAALALRDDLAERGKRVRASTICHGIEALACKLEFEANADSERILGKRAFGRDDESEVWAFEKLSKSEYYVRNTYRQTATRTLRVGAGLGLASGSRFDNYVLETCGQALAAAFLRQTALQGNPPLRKILAEWILGGRELDASSQTLITRLSPESPSAEEQRLVAGRLFDTESPASTKRKRLRDAIARPKHSDDVEGEIIPRLRKNGHTRQADEVEAARAFGAMFDRAQDVLSSAVIAIEGTRGGLTSEQLYANKAVKDDMKALVAAAKNFETKAKKAEAYETTGRTFVKAVEDGGMNAMNAVIARDNQVLSTTANRVTRGPLFRPIDRSNAAVQGPVGDDGVITNEITERTFRIASFSSLIQDLDQ